MNPTAFKKHFKAHPLLHTVAFSAVIHLMAFIIFPTWNSPSLPDKEKVIRVKYLLEKKAVPDEKVSPEPERKIKRKKSIPKEIPEIIRPNIKPKSAIVRSAKIVSPPPHSAKRNPVPIHNSENIFRPITAVLKHASIPHPISDYKMKTPLEGFQAIQPSPRMKWDALNTLIPIPGLAMRSQVTSVALNKLLQEKSFQPALRITNISASTIQTSHNPTVQMKYFTEVNVKNIQKSTSPASSKSNNEQLLPLKTATAQKPLPLALNEIPSSHRPVAGIKNMTTAGRPNPSTILKPRVPQTVNETGSMITANTEVSKSSQRPKQLIGIRAQSPQSLASVSGAQYQPATALAANYFSPPLQRSSLLKEATIPPGFSDEKLNRKEEVDNRVPEKIARLSNGVSDISTELLKKIKTRFSSQVWNRIAQSKYYPRIARKRGFEGQPVVAFTLGNEGDLLELSIVNPSPFKILDEAALDAVKSASPYPPIPKLLKTDSMRFNLPISFMLEE